MNKIGLLAIAALMVLTLSNCTGQGRTISGNGQKVQEERSVGHFEELTVAGSMHVYITQGPVKDARIEAESNLIPYLEFKKDGDELTVKFKNNVHIKNHLPVNVYLSTPNINELNMVGSGEITGQDALSNQDEIQVKTVGSGDIQVQVNAPEVDAKITGSGDINISGKTRKVEIDVLGSGDFKGKDLKSEQAEIKIAGSGDAWVYASINLDVKIFGSGNVYYGGNPKTQSKIAGSGKLMKE